MWGRGLRRNNADLSSEFGPSGADSWMGGFVRILGPCRSLQWILLWGWESLLLLQPPQDFSVISFEALFPLAGTLGCMVCLAPHLFLPVSPITNVRPLGLPATALPWVLYAPSCLSPCLLPVWMNVSSLTPLLLDFHTVWFSGSSVYILILNFLLSFWLCEEAKYIYLCLHLGQKSQGFSLKKQRWIP